MDGVDCNDVTFPTGTESDPCNKNVQYVYVVSNVGNTGNAEFSKLMRTRIGADSEELDSAWPFNSARSLALRRFADSSSEESLLAIGGGPSVSSPSDSGGVGGGFFRLVFL